jgi:peptide/nickel transport system substrate-binding protein
MTPCAIVNFKLVRRHGGTDAQNADKTDTAQPWFDSGASVGAGSGPYLLRRFTLKSPIALSPNRRYWGRTAPAFTRVVLRNMLGIRQLVTIRRGAHEVALDLTARQAETLMHNTRLNVEQPPSTWLFWLFTNSDPQVSPITSNKHFQQAVRAALDYKAFVSLAGPGAIQAPGIIPAMFLGAHTQKSPLHRNLERARSELAAGVGDRTVTLEYPSDLTISGVPLAALARKVQAGLQAAGLHVALAGTDLGTWLARYREGKIPFGLYLWEPDFPDPSDYLAFTPGDVVGLRVGWAKGSDPTVESLAARARVTSAFKPREPLYRQLQLRLNQSGPFVPLIQPAHGFAATKDLRNAVFNQQYDIDVTQVSPR